MKQEYYLVESLTKANTFFLFSGILEKVVSTDFDKYVLNFEKFDCYEKTFLRSKGLKL